jgi:hypothetical protein
MRTSYWLARRQTSGRIVAAQAARRKTKAIA